MCLVDSREQDTPRLRARLKTIGRPCERIALKVGDYSAKVQLPDGEWQQIPAAIERKMSIDELCMCFTRERPRFQREFQRAKRAGIKMYLLIENAAWEDIYGGIYRSRMRSKSLVASILAWQARYSCPVILCEDFITGEIIRDILFYEARETLLSIGENGGRTEQG